MDFKSVESTLNDSTKKSKMLLKHVFYKVTILQSYLVFYKQQKAKFST